MSKSGGILVKKLDWMSTNQIEPIK